MWANWWRVCISMPYRFGWCLLQGLVDCAWTPTQRERERGPTRRERRVLYHLVIIITANVAATNNQTLGPTHEWLHVGMEAINCPTDFCWPRPPYRKQQAPINVRTMGKGDGTVGPHLPLHSKYGSSPPHQWLSCTHIFWCSFGCLFSLIALIGIISQTFPCRMILKPLTPMRDSRQFIM